MTTNELRQKILNDMCELGQRYLQDGNVEAALRWFETAARFALAEIYFYGDGCERDIDTALDYYERAADCGNAKASYRLSQIYRGGDGVEKNLNKAYHFSDKTIEPLLNKIEE